MSSTKGQLFAITGAASGIGRVTATILASHGALLSLSDVQKDPLDALVNTLSAETGAQIIGTALDVTDRAAVDRWMHKTTEHFGRRIDGAANLAGIVGRNIGTERGVVRALSDEEFEAIMRVNVQGTLNCLRSELNHIKTGAGGIGGGSIVNAGSVASIQGVPANAAYVASKHAVLGISRCAAKEEGALGIRVNCIAPGIIDTPMMDHIDQVIGTTFDSPGAMARRGTPEEVANVIVFLLSDEASFVSGMLYGIDGGWAC